MKKFISRATNVVAVLTLMIAIVGALFVLISPDYTFGDFVRGYREAANNYRYGYTDVPFTTSLNSHAYSEQGVVRHHLNITSGGRVYSINMPDLAPASAALIITGDIFPSALFHGSIIMMFGFLIQAISYMWVRGCQSAVSTLWRGRVQQVPVDKGGMADI